jgi:hypothetical protein
MRRKRRFNFPRPVTVLRSASVVCTASAFTWHRVQPLAVSPLIIVIGHYLLDEAYINDEA